MVAIRRSDAKDSARFFRPEAREGLASSATLRGRHEDHEHRHGLEGEIAPRVRRPCRPDRRSLHAGGGTRAPRGAGGCDRLRLLGLQARSRPERARRGRRGRGDRPRSPHPRGDHQRLPGRPRLPRSRLGPAACRCRGRGHPAPQPCRGRPPGAAGRQARAGREADHHHARRCPPPCRRGTPGRRDPDGRAHLRVQSRRARAAPAHGPGRARRDLLHPLRPPEPRPLPVRRERRLGPGAARHLDHELSPALDAHRGVGLGLLACLRRGEGPRLCAAPVRGLRRRRVCPRLLARPAQDAPHYGRRQPEDGGVRRPGGREAAHLRLRGRGRAARRGRGPLRAADLLPPGRHRLPPDRRRGAAGGRGPALHRVHPRPHHAGQRRRQRDRRGGGPRGDRPVAVLRHDRTRSTVRARSPRPRSPAAPDWSRRR